MEAPPIQATRSVREGFYDIIDALCGRFMGLSPFEVMNSDIKDVYSLYVDVIIHDYKSKNKGEPIQWVTSKNASWH